MRSQDFFEQLSEDELPDYKSVGRFFRHRKTGCAVYHVKNDDPENLFSFAFKTLPSDDTGVAHILEHCVLAGSEKFPVKDPFLSLLRGSMYTFLNAMTYPDKTIYPGASVVEKDFFNLLSVYGDAVFFPLLRKEIFHQEGFRYIAEKGEKGFAVRPGGVVFNEMKGYAGNEENAAFEEGIRRLLPGTPYAFNAGGDPRSIPELTYENLKAFHRLWYHPSRALIFLYGNIESEKTLNFLEKEFLHSFEESLTPEEARIGLEPAAPGRDGEPGQNRLRFYENPYPSFQDAEKGTLSLHYLSDFSGTAEKRLAFRLLEELLLGHRGTFFSKRLLDTGAGEDISPISGTEYNLYRMVFSLGLRGVKKEKTREAEKVLAEALQAMVTRGFTHEEKQAAFHSVELNFREKKGGGTGLKLMSAALKNFLYGGEITEALQFTAPLEALKKKARDGFFEELLREKILGNPEHCTVYTYASKQKREEEDREEKAAFEAYASSLSLRAQKELTQENRAFDRFQEQEDSDAPIPSLKRKDVPGEAEKTGAFRLEMPGERFFFLYPESCNGIRYAHFDFPLPSLPAHLNPLLPLFCEVITGSSLKETSYEDYSREMALYTGELAFSVHAQTSYRKKSFRLLSCHLKYLEENEAKAFSLLRSAFLENDFQDRRRIKELFLERYNSLKSSILPRGSSYASLRVEAGFTETAAEEEGWFGLEQLFFLESLYQKGDEGLEEVVRRLRQIYGLVFDAGRVRVCLIGDCPEEILLPVKALLADLPSSLTWEDRLKILAPDMEELKENGMLVSSSFRHAEQREQLVSSSAEVCFHAMGVPASRWGTDEAAHESLLAQILQRGLLWEKIRMAGGAYGAAAAASHQGGYFLFSSYRDPQGEHTLECFREAVETLALKGISSKQLEQALIAVVGKELRPQSPREKGTRAYRRFLYEINDRQRQEHREALLKTTRKDIQRAAERLLSVWEERKVSGIVGRKQASENEKPDFVRRELSF